jgi:hypothetical protein
MQHRPQPTLRPLAGFRPLRTYPTMNALFLTWLTRGIVGSVVLSTLWLANATDQVRRHPSLLDPTDRVATATAEALAPAQR